MQGGVCAGTTQRTTRSLEHSVPAANTVPRPLGNPLVETREQLFFQPPPNSGTTGF